MFKICEQAITSCGQIGDTGERRQCLTDVGNSEVCKSQPPSRMADLCYMLLALCMITILVIYFFYATQH